MNYVIAIKEEKAPLLTRENDSFDHTSFLDSPTLNVRDAALFMSAVWYQYATFSA